MIVREPQILEKVVFVGGLPGCGKTLFTALVGSLDRVEMQKFDYSVEAFCALTYVNAISPDVAKSMIRMFCDLDIYNMMMSREVNFRFRDLSSAFQNPQGLRYFKRLFQEGDNKVVPLIRETKPILQLTLHNLLAISPPLWAALGEKMVILESMRHPAYMLKQWALYVDHYGNDPRDFTVWVDSPSGKAVPYFAADWAEEYLRSPRMDRVILAIDHLMRRSWKVHDELSESDRRRCLMVPFEKFVLDPDQTMDRIIDALGTQRTSKTAKEMKRQKVPRAKVADGIQLKIYEKYGWKSGEAGKSERDEVRSRLAFANAEASTGCMEKLERLCADYESRFSPWS